MDEAVAYGLDYKLPQLIELVIGIRLAKQITGLRFNNILSAVVARLGL